MKIIICKNYDEMSEKSAEIVAAQIKENPNTVLGLATGSTPEGMYACLAKKCADGELSFENVKTANLDEYYPITPDNDQSYRYFMDKHLFDQINIDKNNTNVPDGTASDPDAEGKRYDAMIESLGGIDLQVLGIGRNGHIGFNEPDTKLITGTHVTELTPDTIDANARFFESEADVPRRALTMGIGTILKSKKIIILANGEGKRDAVRRMLENVIDTSCPATLLNLHSDVTLICTADAI